MKDILSLISGPQALILLGGILTLIGAFWSSRQDSNQERELNKKNEIIIEKTQEIAELNSKIVSALTEGNSFPKLSFGYTNENYGTAFIELEGEYPITNVKGKLIDVRELRTHQRAGGLGRYTGGFIFSLDIASPAYITEIIKNERFKLNESRRFMVHFNTPFNSLTQYIAVEVDSTGRKMQAHRIFKSGSEEPIHTDYPEGFPIPLDEIDFLEPLTQ